MKDMDKAEVQGPCTELKITYHDGSVRRIFYNQQEVPFPDGKLIVSRTDLAGIITHCNQSFIDMSGYAREELLGQPHHILRHPDMPAVAYKQLWETIQHGIKWHGYVKNLRKDGCYYWVYTTVIPNIRDEKIIGYTSVRRKPSRSRIEEASQLYTQLRQTAGEQR